MSHPRSTSAHAQPGAAGTNPVFAALWPLMLVAAALLLAGAVTSEWGLLGWLATVAAATAGLFFAMSGAGRNAGRRVQLDNGVVTVEMRRTFPVAAAVFAVILAAFLGLTAVTDDTGTTRLAAGLGCLLLLAPLPDLLRAAVTRTHLPFDATRIAVRSWATDASVDWADVAGVDADISIPSRPAVRVLTRPGAPTLRVRRRRLLLPLEPRSPEGQVVVTALAFDEPWLLADRLATLVDLTPADRAQRLDDNTVQMLTGQLPNASSP